MKKVLFIFVLGFATLFTYGQYIDLSEHHDDATIWDQVDANQWRSRVAIDLNEGELTNSAGLAAALSDETGTSLAVFNTAPTFAGTVTFGGAITQTPTVLEYTTIVTLDSTEIVGSDVGDVGHVDGAVLVTATSSAYILEFVSAVFIYDYLTAAYTGGGDDIVVQEGASGSQVTVSDTITGANLLEASGDKVLRLGAIATEVVPLVGGAISITGTALTQPGTALGSLRVHLTYRQHATGL